MSESSSQVWLCSKAWCGRLRHPGVLAGADAVLDAGAAAVAQLQGGDVGSGLVGEKAGVPVAVLVEDLKLRARVRALTATDQPRALRPARHLQAVGQLGYSGSLAGLAVGVDRLKPRALGQLEDRLADAVVELVADREADPGSAAIGGKRVRRTAAVGAHQDLAIKVCGGELLEGEHGEVIGRRVRARVGGPQDRGQRLAGLVEITADRVKA